ncbi:putative diphthamide synthesis protein [Glomus cerebriforme]|uniref:2-(3-amino-3-carboxypropyl)histidine synthase subunit 2 n=1 Tax=Glomus cerebriforme TaxID=658196 RepID=A0A397SSN3_9GLOM|nr:putative diphthamide synthesis protein [Glomus cerebriforme]
MASRLGPNNFVDDGSAVIERVLKAKSRKLAISAKQLENIYEIDRTVKVLMDCGLDNVALQFPDELLADSAEIATILKERTKKKIFVLADTSYGSCCVDEVAAKHVDAKCIVHYGRSCLSPTSRLPVLYVFGKQPIDLDHCLESFDQFFKQDKDQLLLIMYDVIYSYCINDFVFKLRNEKKFTNIIQTFVETEFNFSNNSEDTSDSKNSGRHYILPENISIENCTIFYIGCESLTLTNIIMTHNKCKVYSYDPEIRVGRQETIQVNKALMKRYYMVQKAKDADVIGIVIGTLGIASYLTIISHLKKLIIHAGKKPYTFVMGKLNVAKMANFMEIECFVLVACPENSLIDSKEFYRPIVTPFELEIALNPSKQWSGEYVTDFQLLLSCIRSNTEEVRKSVLSEDDDEPHFSLVTGKYKQSRKYAARDMPENIADSMKDLTLRNQNTSVSTLLNSAAGEYLNSRTFQGLEQIKGIEVQLAEEGQSGIAKSYTNEYD